MRAFISAILLAQTIAFPPANATEATSETVSGHSATAQLETAFWVCDYAGTNGTVGVADAAACIAITDELKRKKFAGDFDGLVSWWKLNKVTRHQELERVDTATLWRTPSGLQAERGRAARFLAPMLIARFDRTFPITD